jgi:hypothetical protein
VRRGISVRPDRGIGDAVKADVGVGTTLHPVQQGLGRREAEVVIRVGRLLIGPASFGIARRADDRVSGAI